MASNRVFFIPAGFHIQFHDFMIRYGNAGVTGGGIHNEGSDLSGAGLALRSNMTTLNQSVISNNKAFGQFAKAGGIYMADGSLAINQTTIRQNEGAGIGGGLNYSQGELSITESTFYGNKSSFGGGIYLYTSGAESATARITNSLIAGNVDNTAFPTISASDCFGELSSLGYNLIGTLGFQLAGKPCSITGTGTGSLIDPMPILNPLTDNGGPTPTHALQPGSSAVNAGNPSGCIDFDQNLLAEDQRGALRIDRCDIGANELDGLVQKVDMPLLIRP